MHKCSVNIFQVIYVTCPRQASSIPSITFFFCCPASGANVICWIFFRTGTLLIEYRTDQIRWSKQIYTYLKVRVLSTYYLPHIFLSVKLMVTISKDCHKNICKRFSTSSGMCKLEKKVHELFTLFMKNHPDTYIKK